MLIAYNANENFNGVERPLLLSVKKYQTIKTTAIDNFEFSIF